jgi:hypothetical protein
MNDSIDLKKIGEKALARLDSFTSDMNSRTQTHFALLGEFIHVHIVLEKMILNYVKRRNPNIGPIEKIIWGFKAKLQIAKQMPDSVFDGPLFKPVNQVNEIRNKFGHRMDAVEIPEADLVPIRKFLEAWPKTKSLDGMSLVRVFVATVAMILESMYQLEDEIKALEQETVRNNEVRLKNLEEMTRLIEQLYPSDTEAEISKEQL